MKRYIWRPRSWHEGVGVAALLMTAWVLTWALLALAAPQ